MKAIECTAGLIVVAVVLAPLAADPPVTKAEKKTPAELKFVVYSSAEDAELASSMFGVLRGSEKRARFAKADSIEKAAESEADVLILVMTRRDLPKVEPKTLEALKKRRIVGLGAGAAQLFGQLGLEINLGACAHFGNEPPPSIKIVKSELLGTPKSTDPFPILQDAAEEGEAKYDNFAVFLPPRGSNASVIDALARCADQPNYAPIARQDNCILIGVPVPAARWTEAYTRFIQDACQALHERKTQPYAAARREVTKPGKYEFKLATAGSTDEPFEKTFYLKFSEATKVTARLEHAGSNSVMLLFMGQDEGRTHWTRQDAKKEETLEISASINDEDIQALADRYWVLKVTNFGKNAPADCKLTISCEKP